MLCLCRIGAFNTEADLFLFIISPVYTTATTRPPKIPRVLSLVTADCRPTGEAIHIIVWTYRVIHDLAPAYGRDRPVSISASDSFR